MNNYFDAPPEGALQTQSERALAVKYKSNKTPEAYANSTEGDLKRFVENGALGFHYYDKEEKKKVPLHELTFVVLEVYAGVSGYDEPNKISYWSNRVRDTRTDEIVLFSSVSEGPIAKGLYHGKTNNSPALIGDKPVPAGASYTKFVKAYCINLDRVIEVELTTSSERGMQKAVSAAENKAGRNTKWEKVFILGLAQNDHLWGFHLVGYARETKTGEDYAGKGELYFSPNFHAGTVSPVNQPDLHAKCREYQQAERDAHESYKNRHASNNNPIGQHGPASTPPVQPAQASGDPFPAYSDAPPETDDLPF